MAAGCDTTSPRRAPDEASHPARRGDDPTIDIHCHVLVPDSEQLVAHEFEPVKDPFIHHLGEASAAYNRKHYGDIVPKMTDVSVRLADMDRMGIDVQAVSIAPAQYYYWAPPDLGAAVSRIQNDHIAEVVDRAPDRLVALGTLPMQDVDAAVAELDRVVTRLGFCGVSINPNAEGTDYDDPRYEPFWQKVVEYDAVVVLHPNGFTHGARLDEHYLINVVGNPMESTVAVSRMIFGGVFERHPDAKVCVVHGGGYLPFYPDRMDHAYEARPDCRQRISRPPSTYLRDLWFDTVVFGDSLRHLVDRVGHERLVLGTDYPYDMGESDPLGRIAATPNLGEEEVRAVTGGNAARLLGLA